MSAYKNILFVDYENLRVELSAIPPDTQVRVFFGAAQKTVTKDFMSAAHKMGPRFVQVDIEGQAKNALDFHIAFYLGEHLAASAQTDCIIISKDKGYDPLVKHLCDRGLKVRRAETIVEASSSSTTSQPIKSPKTQASSKAKIIKNATVSSILSWLKELKAKPKNRKSLLAHLHATFRKVPELELDQLVNQIIAQKKISEVGGALEYHL